jgi:hypothetical protein
MLIGTHQKVNGLDRPGKYLGTWVGRSAGQPQKACQSFYSGHSGPAILSAHTVLGSISAVGHQVHMTLPL